MQIDATEAVSPVERFFEFSLLGLLASGFLAVVGSGFLDMPTMLFTAVALIVRALIVAGLIRFRLPAGVVTAITLAYAGFYPVDYFFISGPSFVPAAVHLVFFVAVIKILTASTNRDYFLLKIIAFLELLAACVLSERVNFFVFLLFFLILGVATFASGEIRQSRQRRITVAKTSARGLSLRLAAVAIFVSVAILVITAGLFFFLPRTARAAFQHLTSPRFHLAGFSNRVTLGEIGEIKKENTPVMHVKMDKLEDRGLALKWRGAALSEFDGRTWSNPPTQSEILQPDRVGQLVLEHFAPPNGSRHVSYAVHLEEMASDALFFAGTAEYLRIDSTVFRNSLDNYRVRFSDSHNLSYQVYSRVEPPLRENDVSVDFIEPLRQEWRSVYLRLPNHVDVRIGKLAKDIVGVERSPAKQARLVENYLRSNYGYTLELPQAEPADPLAFFLLHRKKGHCEYFASSMAVLLRLIGIPSRVVTGFQSGVYNPISGAQLIRTSDAHAWVEAWLPHRGWTTFDPTPPDPNQTRISLWTRLGFYADAAEVFWQDWVLNYNLDRQLQLATRMGESSRHVGVNWFDGVGPFFSRLWTATFEFVKLHGALLLGLVAIGLLVRQFGRDGWRWWNTRRRVLKVQRGQGEASDATLLYQRMLRVLHRRGIEKPAWLTPFEFARVLQEPELALLVEDLTAAYNELRFGGNPEAAGRILGLLEKLEAIA
jgi:transglutaminase-like putative cysteine protease